MMSKNNKRYRVSHPKYGEVFISAIHWAEALDNGWRRLLGHHHAPTVCGLNWTHAECNACETLEEHENFRKWLLDNGWEAEESP